MLEKGRYLKQKQQELERQKYKLYDITLEIQNKIKASRRIVDDQVEKIDKIKMDKNQAESQFFVEERLAAQLRQKIGHSTKIKKDLQDQINSLQAQLTQALSKKKRLEESLQEKRQEFKEKKIGAIQQIQINNLVGQQAGLGEEQTGLKELKATFQGRLKKLKKESQKQNLQKKMDKLQADLIKINKAIKQTTIKVDGLKQLFEKQQNERKSIQMEVNSLQKEKDEISEQIDRKKHQQSRKQFKAKRQQQDIKYFEQLLREANRQRSTYEKNRNRTSADLEKAERVKKAEEQKLEALEAEKELKKDQLARIRDGLRKVQQELSNIRESSDIEDIENIYRR